MCIRHILTQIAFKSLVGIFIGSWQLSPTLRSMLPLFWCRAMATFCHRQGTGTCYTFTTAPGSLGCLMVDVSVHHTSVLVYGRCNEFKIATPQNGKRSQATGSAVLHATFWDTGPYCWVRGKKKNFFFFPSIGMGEENGVNLYHHQHWRLKLAAGWFFA